MAKICGWGLFAALIGLSSLLLLHPGTSQAQQRDRAPGLNLGDAVVTGFSGVIAPDLAQPRPANKSAIDLTFINRDGPSARIVRIGRPGYVWDGRVFQAPKTFDVLAKDVGQVFGIALDDQSPPNIYLAATSAFGLQLVGRGGDGLPERRKVGGPGAGWMAGQFGLDLQGDPGSIYKVDGTTGVVSLFAKVMLNGVPNPGPALGNLAYDAAHKQLLVSDLYTGMIHRIAIADGSEPGPPYDHGVTGRGAASLAPVPFTPGNRPNIATGRFDSENPGTWGFAPPERRVWGLTVHAGRLYYSARNGAATDGPQIWSVGIQQDGSFASDARWELDVPANPGPYPVSDIVFSGRGAMILAQRAPIASSYDYSAFTKPGEPRVLRYWPKEPNDPPSAGQWKPVAEEYAVGFAGNYRNANGGVDFGYGYDRNGALSTADCDATLVVTGEKLRLDPALRDRLLPGGPMQVDGLQIGPANAVRDANAPPWTSYFVDYDDKFDETAQAAHVGGVRVYNTPCCAPMAANGAAANPSNVGGQQAGGGTGTGPGTGPGGGTGGGPGGGTIVPGGCVGPQCPHPAPACFAGRGTFECNPATGKWVYQLTVSGPGWINTVTATSLTSGISVPGGPIPLNPANIPVSGAPGSSAVIDICAFNAAAAASGKPYDCCHTKVRVTIPDRVCGIKP